MTEKAMKYLSLLIFMLLPATIAWSQEDTIPTIKYSGNTRSAAMKLSTSLEKDSSDRKIAFDYLILAKELMKQGEYVKAELYLNNASKLYQKLNDKEQLAYVNRELAKVKEAQNKLRDAISNYSEAVKLSQNKQVQELNINDVKRLKNKSNPVVQATYIQRNIDILNADEDKEERAVAYQQMAEVNMKMNNQQAAISNLESALEDVKDKPVETIKVKREIATAYAADKKMEAAAASLLQSYELALKEGHTIEAKKSLEQLAAQYQKMNKPQKALDLYKDFMSQLEPMVKADSTLIDSRFFEVHEKRIAQLEKERVLKDELIRKQNKFNSFLLGSIVLILICMAFILRAWYSIRRKNKKIALQSLRREMNPHFIFNSLNSVNQFIARNDELAANKYLSSYSRLMRNTLENSNKDFTPLATELEQLKEYLELEHMRFQDKFTYQIQIDESFDMEAILIPNMLIQPQLENAIWHGLRYKENSGLLTLTIRKKASSLSVVIEDNGIGLTKSRELKTKHQREHHSRGLTNTYERIHLLNSLYNCHITIDITEKTGNESGVIVTFHFPIQHKK
ncbi:histidine kinase [Parabacteroides acidifaciens]|uniref:Histidine kinase n=1 Tax=Parabacteroides acidifaciens TaxID=2290935 RepID=A0A3D8HJE8_9BACT|nr:histidine kinase [Parabacteroides acidifaciens]MBC8600104.1 histidine kinase [Parabacteroides acidifaciens]RDU51061.1 sensor histidine kinase [Parabacteroides acidifaciens]